MSNEQIQTLWARGDGGRSTYQAFYTPVRRRMSNGLTFSGTYTLSTAKDQAGVRQNVTGSPSTAFDLDIDYGPADFDRRHVFNHDGVYDLPFGRNGGALSRLTGGWYVAGIFSATSGVPLDVCQRAAVFGGGLSFTNCVGAVPIGNVDTGVFEGVAGSNGIGTTGNPATGGSGINMFADPAAGVQLVPPRARSARTRRPVAERCTGFRARTSTSPSASGRESPERSTSCSRSRRSTCSTR